MPPPPLQKHTLESLIRISEMLKQEEDSLRTGNVMGSGDSRHDNAGLDGFAVVQNNLGGFSMFFSFFWHLISVHYQTFRSFLAQCVNKTAGNLPVCYLSAHSVRCCDEGDCSGNLCFNLVGFLNIVELLLESLIFLMRPKVMKARAMDQGQALHCLKRHRLSIEKNICPFTPA
jgi:hypothetical protein